MSKEDLIIRISKVQFLENEWYLSIQTTPLLSSQTVVLPMFGKLPKEGSKELRAVIEKLQTCFELIFKAVKELFNSKTEITYKCIFSDKFIANGNASIQGKKIETGKELIIPMNEREVALVFNCIPRHY